MYVASALLVLVVMIMGVTTLSNFDKMKSVQTTLETMAGASSGGDSVQAKETSGTVTAAEGEEMPQEAEVTEVPASAEVSDSVPEQEGTGSQVTDPTVPNEEQIQTEEDTQQSEEVAEDGIYVVEQGDTLAIISKKAYGDLSHVEAICKMNGITDGNLIYVGQKLLLP